MTSGFGIKSVVEEADLLLLRGVLLDQIIWLAKPLSP